MKNAKMLAMLALIFLFFLKGNSCPPVPPAVLYLDICVDGDCSSEADIRVGKTAEIPITVLLNESAKVRMVLCTEGIQVEKLESDIIANYNSYLRTGDFSGTAANAYLQFIPFERGTSNADLLDPNSRQGPNANSNVMCLTCHRAHASAFDNSGRWDFKASLLSQSHPANGDAGVTPTDVQYSYYGRDISSEFGSGQGQFCEKCHGSQTP